MTVAPGEAMFQHAVTADAYSTFALCCRWGRIAADIGPTCCRCGCDCRLLPLSPRLRLPLSAAAAATAAAAAATTNSPLLHPLGTVAAAVSRPHRGTGAAWVGAKEEAPQLVVAVWVVLARCFGGWSRQGLSGWSRRAVAAGGRDECSRRVVATGGRG